MLMTQIVWELFFDSNYKFIKLNYTISKQEQKNTLHCKRQGTAKIRLPGTPNLSTEVNNKS